MRLADAARAEQDYVLAARDVLAAGKIQHQHLVERRDRLEVEALELFDDREPGLLDTPLDEAALAVDQLQLHQPGEELDMIQASAAHWRASFSYSRRKVGSFSRFR